MEASRPVTLIAAAIESSIAHPPTTPSSHHRHRKTTLHRHLTTESPPDPTATMNHERDPCPWVVLNDFGGAFCMGVRDIPPHPPLPHSPLPQRFLTL